MSSHHYITKDQLDILLHGLVLDKEQMAVVKTVLTRKVFNLPKEHEKAVGTAFYGALSGATPWEIVNGTGSVISLLITSIRDAGNPPQEKEKIDQAHNEWAEAMRVYATKNDDSQQYRAAAACQRILGNIGKLAYQYGTVPSGGFRLPVNLQQQPQGGQK